MRLVPKKTRTIEAAPHEDLVRVDPMLLSHASYRRASLKRVLHNPTMLLSTTTTARNSSHPINQFRLSHHSSSSQIPTMCTWPRPNAYCGDDGAYGSSWTYHFIQPCPSHRFDACREEERLTEFFLYGGKRVVGSTAIRPSHYQPRRCR